MSINNVVVAHNAAKNLSNHILMLNFIKEYPSKEGELAKKEYKRFNLITILFVLFIMLPLCFFSIINLINYAENPYIPEPATQRVNGHISYYEDTFWYTDSSEKHEFAFEDYDIDTSYEKGEVIWIYLDDNNNVISVSHQEEPYGIVIGIVAMFIVPIVFLIFHSIAGKKLYAKNYHLYALWFEKEIKPYYYDKNIISNKKFYNVVVDINRLSEDVQKKYKKYKAIYALCIISIILCLIATICVCTIFKLDVYSVPVVIAVFIYVGILYVPITKYEKQIKEIKYGYKK